MTNNFEQLQEPKDMAEQRAAIFSAAIYNLNNSLAELYKKAQTVNAVDMSNHLRPRADWQGEPEVVTSNFVEPIKPEEHVADDPISVAKQAVNMAIESPEQANVVDINAGRTSSAQSVADSEHVEAARRLVEAAKAQDVKTFLEAA